jgi:zinc protease
MSLFSKVASIMWWMPALAVIWMAPMTAKAMDTNLTRFTLSNGLEVIIQEDHARQVASIQLWVMVGSADEKESELGISHLIEHMAFKGTDRRGLGQIAAEVDALGGDINAYTSWDETVFHITVPSSATLKGLDILTDAVLRPVIDPVELEKEKKVVLEEILEGEERPERKASKLLFKTAYVKSPYRHPIIGFKKIVEGFKRKDIIDFRKQWYVPENMFFVIVGDVDAEKIASELEKLTADIKPKGFFAPPRPQEPVQKKIRSALIRDRNTRQTRLHVAYHIPSLKGNDVNALDLAADILGSRQSSRLVRAIKKEKGLVNNISAYALTPKMPGLFVISSTLEAKNLVATTKAIDEELSKLASTPPSAEELERAKTYIESQHLYSRETVQGIARSVGSFRADLDDPSYEEKYLKLNASVTAEQVSRAVRGYLSAPNLTISAMLPEDGAPELKIEQLVEIFQPGERSEALVKKTDQEKDVLRKTLPNGVKVILVRDTSNPLVSFRIACLGGKRFEDKNNEGIMNFIAAMLTKGAGGLSEMELSKKIEDMGGRLTGFSGYDSFGLAASFFSRNLDEGLGLLADIYANPTFPEDKIERERTLIINRIKTEPDRPIPFAIKNLNQTLFPEHPYGFNKEGTLTTVAGFNRDQLLEEYRRFAVPSNAVISGVGDMDLEKAMKRISQLFGKIPDTPLVVPDIPKEEPLAGVKKEIVRIPRAKAHIVIGFRGVTLKDPERYPLEVLNNILSGMGGRLFTELRDKESLAYTVTSFVRPGMNPGAFAFYMGCDESKREQALKGLFREIRRVRETPVGEEEMERSKSNLLGNHKIALQSSWSRSENKALNTLYGLGYDYDKKFIENVSRVTSADVLEAARKFLNPENCVIVQILPEDDSVKTSAKQANAE